MTEARADIADSTAFRLHRATVLVDRVADQYLHTHHGIHYSGFLVLLMVGVLGRPTQRQIADHLDVSRASITQRVERLRSGGALAVEQDPDDRRVHRVSLTAAGAALLDAAWQGLDSHQAGIDTGVDEVELARQLDRLIANALAVLTPVPPEERERP
jgi:DNA-binding MarR family transcriptional regulator